jgi:hypothetical protein
VVQRLENFLAMILTEFRRSKLPQLIPLGVVSFFLLRLRLGEGVPDCLSETKGWEIISLDQPFQVHQIVSVAYTKATTSQPSNDKSTVALLAAGDGNNIWIMFLGGGEERSRQDGLVRLLLCIDPSGSAWPLEIDPLPPGHRMLFRRPTVDDPERERGRESSESMENCLICLLSVPVSEFCRHANSRNCCERMRAPCV